MRVLCADALDALRDMAEDSVDALVTDPPAGIAFMGKEWDAHLSRERFVASLTPIFAECLRVMKPGAHGVVWALPRTSHWTATALEDAGFEIRDVVTHLFGSGFPKSLDVSKAIDKMRKEDVEPVRVVCRYLRAAMDANGLKSADVAPAFGCHSRLIDKWAARDTDSQPALPTWEQWLALKPMLSLPDDMDAEVWRLNGRKGSPGDTWRNAEVVGEHEGVPGGFGDYRFAVRDALIRAPSDDAKKWSGWGTALKPASEHWIVVRKPLSEKSVAANVLKHGTGALNIDGCRIGTGEVLKPGGSLVQHPADERTGAALGMLAAGTPNTFVQNASGRWPANVVLSHHPLCERVGEREVKGDPRDGREGERDGGFVNTGAVGGNGKPCGPLYGTETQEVWDCVPGCAVAQLDAQSGEIESGKPSGVSNKGMGFHGSAPGFPVTGYGDRGGASRFFYVAKPSSAEKQDALRRLSLFDANPSEKPEKNAHPTVKPVALMQHLIRLVCPPGGLLLDPFAGSGTTGVAATDEGVSAILVEREPDSAATATARCARAAAERGYVAS
ncbi:MAG: DNA methyltransferase [Candidatus Velthaea sp.]